MVADNYHRRLVLEIMDEMREPIQSGTIDTSSQAMDELVKRLSAIRKPRDEVKPVRLQEASVPHPAFMPTTMKVLRQ